MKNCLRLGVRLRCGKKRAWLAGNQTLTTHDVANHLRRPLTAFINQIGLDRPIPASALKVFKEVMNPGTQRLTPDLRGGLWTTAPVAET